METRKARKKIKTMAMRRCRRGGCRTKRLEKEEDETEAPLEEASVEKTEEESESVAGSKPNTARTNNSNSESTAEGCGDCGRGGR